MIIISSNLIFCTYCIQPTKKLESSKFFSVIHKMNRAYNVT